MSVTRGSFLDRRILAKNQAILYGAEAVTSIRLASKPLGTLAWSSDAEMLRVAVERSVAAFRAARIFWSVDTGCLQKHEAWSDMQDRAAKREEAASVR